MGEKRMTEFLHVSGDVSTAITLVRGGHYLAVKKPPFWSCLQIAFSQIWAAESGIYGFVAITISLMYITISSLLLNHNMVDFNMPISYLEQVVDRQL